MSACPLRMAAIVSPMLGCATPGRIDMFGRESRMRRQQLISRAKTGRRVDVNRAWPEAGMRLNDLRIAVLSTTTSPPTVLRNMFAAVVSVARMASVREKDGPRVSAVPWLVLSVGWW
ncbi:hypothetical protein BD309DRAFT_975055 [Dichomitus squalens]|uniref:Uncharacterized protein n=1 Tax=Dichomitus squalens TaxID=114155 RepID=A0A4Q9PAL8_9APHY|nr:hypothetical protein BD309DRAFT_975055 [Dichomitus squalens]TBU51740.1 hypothetical protein BD310DRAFT_316597 [Dichomitus squalens]